MKRRLTEPFGKAGLIVGVVALVFAMLGGAYAATGESGGGKATASAKAKQGKQGKPGKTGPAGPTGPAGANGTNGKDGTNGTNGAPGTAGQSVTGAPIAANTECGKKTGVKYTLGATSTKVCSGEDGLSGFTATLPSGETEKGTWGWGSVKTEDVFVPISFNIPLAGPLGENKVHYLEPGVETSECPGTAEAPEALSGNLCVYSTFNQGFNDPPNSKLGLVQIFAPGELAPAFQGHGGNQNKGSGTTGAMVLFIPKEEESLGYGSWAVTAP